jgi:hypothetical protein
MALEDELAAAAGHAAAGLGPGERLEAVLPTEAQPGRRVYLCAFEHDASGRSWLALREDGSPVTDRRELRDAVSIAALCELAEETAAGGDLDDLRARLVALRLTEDPPGIDEAQEALDALQHVLGSPPSLATPARLDAIGVATRRLELALGGATQGSPFAVAMKGSTEVVDALLADVQGSYRAGLR